MTVAAAERLDERLARTAALSRTRAAASIRAGCVRVNGAVSRKTGRRVTPADIVELLEHEPYVSRAGRKLAGALDAFALDPRGARVLDVGISTGGFSDCLLQRGAVAICGVDVGHGQLAPALRTDPRIELYEGVNARDLRSALPGLGYFDLIVVDVSFISLRYIFPELPAYLAPGGRVLTLVKPQFEAGREHLGSGGVVRERAVQDEVLLGMTVQAQREGFVVLAQIESPLTGMHGNREFFLLLARNGDAG